MGWFFPFWVLLVCWADGVVGLFLVLLCDEDGGGEEVADVGAFDEHTEETTTEEEDGDGDVFVVFW